MVSDRTNDMINGFYNVQARFDDVSAVLRGSPAIGTNHALWNKWEGMHRDYVEIVEQSCQNAKECTDFLNEFHTVLIHLAQSTAEEKGRVIDVFLQDIPAHAREAEELAERFSNLRREMRNFPKEVQNCLYEAKGFCEKLWNKVTTWCEAVANNLVKVVSTILLELLESSVGPKERIDVPGIPCDFSGFMEWLRQSSCRARKDPYEPAAKQVRYDCDHIAYDLFAFVHIWKKVEDHCFGLRDTFTRAGGLVGLPLGYDPLMQHSAIPQLRVLIQCLDAYSRREAPTFQNI